MRRISKGRQTVLSFKVPGPPVPQERPRVRAFMNPHTGRPQASVYTRKGPIKDYKARISFAAYQAIEGGERFESTIFMNLVFWVEKPKSKPKYKVWPCVKPDLSNYIKAVEDALTGIVYRDDSQICGVKAMKAYAGNLAPHTQITIRHLDEDLAYVSDPESA